MYLLKVNLYINALIDISLKRTVKVHIVQFHPTRVAVPIFIIHFASMHVNHIPNDARKLVVSQSKNTHFRSFVDFHLTTQESK